jgi:hypothetical protein
VPTETRITLEAPVDCCASVVLKLVAIDRSSLPTTRFYAWWVVAGRYESDGVPLEFAIKGEEEAYRMDVPRGVLLSSEYLQHHLTQFFRDGKTPSPEDTPIIRG